MLLTEINSSAIKKATDKKCTAEELTKINNLIMCNNQYSIRIDSDFKPFEDIFDNFMDVRCKNCRYEFNSNLLSSGLICQEVYEPKTITFLQEKKSKLIYHNVSIIEHEHNCAK